MQITDKQLGLRNARALVFVTRRTNRKQLMASGRGVRFGMADRNVR